jgi:hypothetical protein
MKKIVSVLVGVILFTLITPVIAVSPESSMESEQTETATNTPVVITPVMAAAEEYTLPYPGILSDNPLYFLKTIRDRIMEWLITDPLRKIDFYLLQSDKNLNAGIMLNLANKKTLVLKTLAQSATDMEKAVSLATSVKSSGGVVPTGVVEHIERSMKKHQEVFTDLAASTLLTKVKSLEESVSKLR